MEVAPGYGRNYLIPQGKAVLASRTNLKSIEHERSLIQRKAELVRKDAEDWAERIRGVTLTLTRKAADEDKLYGSVSVGDISRALEEAGVAVERKMIKLDEPIKTLGEYQVSVKVHAEFMQFSRSMNIFSYTFHIKTSSKFFYESFIR